MDDEYDVVVCGTGLKECILSGLLSHSGKKVLHVDRNSYYGAEAASVNLTTLWEKFRPGEKPPESYGLNRDWNIDLIPKMVMASGKLVQILVKTGVSNYLEWKSIDGTFVYQFQEAGFFSGAQYIHRVPNTVAEVLASPLMGLLEKNRCKNFVQFVLDWDDSRPATRQGFDPATTPMTVVYEKFGLGESTVDFIGHAIALYTNDQYLTQPCGSTIDKIKLYLDSFSRYGNSPFIYPMYGLGVLPEGFSRLSAIHNGVYMLRKPIDGFEYDETGAVCGVRSGEEVAKCKMVICDPSYAPVSKKREVGRVIRAICILGAPIPHTKDAPSCQIIIPQKQLRRRNDIYVSMVSSTHCVAYKGKYIAIVSTTVETANPEAEIEPAIRLLGPIEQKFVSVSELCVPTDNGTTDKVFVTESYDPLSHFESATDDVLRLWQNITGAPLDLTITADAAEG